MNVKLSYVKGGLPIIDLNAKFRMMMTMMIMIIIMTIMMINEKLKYVKGGLPIIALGRGLNSAPIRKDDSNSFLFSLKHCIV